jgi:hypothetical protein
MVFVFLKDLNFIKEKIKIVNQKLLGFLMLLRWL